MSYRQGVQELGEVARGSMAKHMGGGPGSQEEDTGADSLEREIWGFEVF